MTDAESILAALEPEDEIQYVFCDPRENWVVDTAAVGLIACGEPPCLINVVHPPVRKALSFDDVWGNALEQANVTDESIKTLGEFLILNTRMPGETIGEILDGEKMEPMSWDLIPPTDPHDELLNLLSKLRD